MGLGNTDMETARLLWPEHPEVQMFRRRCLGDAQALHSKANGLAEAGDDRKAIQVSVTNLLPCVESWLTFDRSPSGLIAEQLL